MRAIGIRSLATAACLLAVGAAGASAADVPGDGPLSSRLFELSSPDLRSASPAEQADAISLLNRGAGSLLRDGGAIVVEIRTSGEPRTSVPALRDAGAEIVHVSDTYRTVAASVDERELRDVAGVAGLEYVEEVITPMTGAAEDGAGSGAINTCATGVVSEGDVQLKSGAARTQFDVDGSGVKVGVLSDSYDTRPSGLNASDDVASGDLPGPGNPCARTTPVQVLDDPTNCGSVPSPADCSDEGRAMLQIVHDLAPGSPLAFATAFGGQSLFADNIRALASAGAKVIVDDVIYFTEPAYQDGTIAKAVNDVTAQGVSYFSMAFNNNGNGLNSYEAPNGYRSTSCPASVLAFRAGGADSCMDFDPGVGVDNRFDVNVDAARVILSMSYGEPMFGVADDFDIYLINPNTSDSVSIAGVSNNLTSQTPTEAAANDLGGGTRQIVIRRHSGTGNPPIKFISNDNGGNFINSTQAVISPDVQGPTINGHNGAANAQTVAAVPFNNSATVEPFSSRGPVTYLFAPINGATPAPALGSPLVLQKPDISATDRGINTFFGFGNRFSGTSAAAPHAAAVGALQLEANAALSSTQVKNAQKATADPVGAFGPLAAGAGLVDAQAAIASAPPATPAVTLGPTPGTTNSATLSFPFTTTGDVRTLTCQVDAGPQQPCGSPFSTPLPAGDGPHSVTVRATDYFGQTGQAQAPFTVDTTGPATEFDKTPKNKTTKPKAKFAFSSEPGATFVCALDRKPFKPCTDRFKKKVKPGKHKFRVQATDALGNIGPPESDRWKLKKS